MKSKFLKSSVAIILIILICSFSLLQLAALDYQIYLNQNLRYTDIIVDEPSFGQTITRYPNSFTLQFQSVGYWYMNSGFKTIYNYQYGHYYLLVYRLNDYSVDGTLSFGFYYQTTSTNMVEVSIDFDTNVHCIKFDSRANGITNLRYGTRTANVRLDFDYMYIFDVTQFGNLTADEYKTILDEYISDYSNFVSSGYYQQIDKFDGFINFYQNLPKCFTWIENITSTYSGLFVFVVIVFSIVLVCFVVFLIYKKFKRSL